MARDDKKKETGFPEEATVRTSSGEDGQLENSNPGVKPTGSAARFLYPAAVIAVAILLLMMVAV